MALKSRIPEITAEASLRMQRAINETGEHVEYLATQKAARRRSTGREQTSIRWRPNKSNPHQGIVVAGAFYTRFSEYGTVFQSARPILGPAAEEAFPAFEHQVDRVYR